MKHGKNLLNIIVYTLVIISLLSVSVFSAYGAQTSVNLGTAGDFVILAKSGISTTGTTSITGDIGVSPIDSTAITGFGLIMDSSNTFATSSLVTGKAYAADYTPPTPTKMTTAISDMQTAYTDAQGRTNPTATELGAGNIGGMTIAPGLYKWGTGVSITNGVTLSGGANDIWIFQIAQDLTVDNGAIITLSGGAQAKNIFWVVAGQVTLGTTANMKGIILSQTAISINTGATLNGRALAQTAVTLDANAVTAPTSASTSTSTSNTGSSSGSSSSSGSTSSGSTSSGSSGASSGTTSGSSGSSSSKEGVIVKANNTLLNANKTISVVKNDSTTKSAYVEKNQTTQGIGQELNQQISERKEEIKSGDYTSPLGQLMNVRELSANLKELRVNNIAAQTNLTITAEINKEGKTKLKTKLKNGTESEIKIMPDTASQKALEQLKIKVCSSDNNCTIQLKNVGNGTTEKIQYEVQLDKHSKLFGLFQKKMHVSVDVDAQTGNTKVHKPWWSFMATQATE